jgi:hypothetical protein
MSGYSAELAVILVRDLFGPTTAVFLHPIMLTPECGGRVTQERKDVVAWDSPSGSVV